MVHLRDYKGFGAGEWYHVFTRGNGKMNVFREVQDYSVLLHRLQTALGTNAQDVQGMSKAPFGGIGGKERVRITPFKLGTFSLATYCLMPNHFHFLIRQNTEVSISSLFLRLLTSYSKYFNRKYDHVGHVFQDRFKAVHIGDDTQLLHVSAYIHQNPKVAGLVRRLERWPHSSYQEYLQETEGGLCDTTVLLEQFKNAREYTRYVEEAFDDIRARKDVQQAMIDV